MRMLHHTSKARAEANLDPRASPLLRMPDVGRGSMDSTRRWKQSFYLLSVIWCVCATTVLESRHRFVFKDNRLQGSVRVMENLESHGILQYFPGLESLGI